MSDKKKYNDPDNKNTNTIYIPADARERYNRQRKKKKKSTRQHNEQNRQYYQSQQQYPNQQYYQNQQQYPNQQYYQNQQQYPNQQYYQNQQQYPNQQYYQNQQQYPNQQYYQNQQQYPNQQYQNRQYREQQSHRYPQRPMPPKKRPAQQQVQKKKKRKKSNASEFILRVIMFLLIILILILGIYSCTAMSFINKMNLTESGSRNRTAGALNTGYVQSILLIGTDGRTPNEQGRSDTMILMSVNSSTDEIILTSFMRDCYVEVPGYGWDKLNAAYSYGGADLLMDTIEQNFRVRIDDYVSVNFVTFVNLVDSVGGIDIDVSDAEAQEINTIMQAEVNSIMGDDIYADMLSGGGHLHLNGKQALSYARIRYVGNADFERTERQRRVLGLVMDRLKTMNPFILNNIAQDVMPNTVTNMSKPKLYFLPFGALRKLGYERRQLQIPVDGSYYGASTDSGDALIVDFDQNHDVIKNTVFAQK